MTLIFLLGIIPLIIEVIIDFSLWRKNKSDKPISTWIRAGMIIALMFIAGAEVALASLFFYCFYDNIIGLIKHGNPLYLGNSKLDMRLKAFPWFFVLGGRLIISSFFLFGYWSNDTIFTGLINWLNTWM